MCRTFFHFESLLAGFETIVNRLYGLSFRALLPDKGEVWPGNVLKLNVYRDEADDGTTSCFLGTIFIDIDNRSTKGQSDCHFTVRCFKMLDSDYNNYSNNWQKTYQTPIVVLSLSFAPPELQNQISPTANVFESLCLDPHQAENFFHEMGHAIHSILGRTRYQHVAGTRCPTDFAEVPSHLMECYFNDPRILVQICKDRSGRALSSDQAEAIVGSKYQFSTIRTLQQVLYSLLDLEIHGEKAHEIAEGRLSTTELFGNLAAKTIPKLQRTNNYAYHHRISHLVTYGGKYYSYLVARALSSLIYRNLFVDDPFSRTNGLKWAEAQSCGGEYPSTYLLKSVLGELPSIDQLTLALSKPAK